jgi:ABC-type dipeptide/oligopeptide/nickel transport system permease subunit
MRFTDVALAFPRIFLWILFAIVFMRPAFSDNLNIVFVFSALYRMPIARVMFIIGILGWLEFSSRRRANRSKKAR